MILSHGQLTKLTELQLEYFKLTNHMNELKELLKQICVDHCELKISVNLHNLVRHEKQEAKKKIEDLEDAYGYPPALLQMMPGFARGARIIPQESGCRSVGVFTSSETTGIRILNAVLLEKEESRAAVTRQIEAILIPTLKIEIETNSNPIQYLHRDSV